MSLELRSLEGFSPGLLGVGLHVPRRQSCSHRLEWPVSLSGGAPGLFLGQTLETSFGNVFCIVFVASSPRAQKQALTWQGDF